MEACSPAPAVQYFVVTEETRRITENGICQLSVYSFQTRTRRSLPLFSTKHCTVFRRARRVAAGALIVMGSLGCKTQGHTQTHVEFLVSLIFPMGKAGFQVV